MEKILTIVTIVHDLNSLQNDNKQVFNKGDLVSCHSMFGKMLRILTYLCIVVTLAVSLKNTFSNRIFSQNLAKF